MAEILVSDRYPGVCIRFEDQRLFSSSTESHELNRDKALLALSILLGLPQEEVTPEFITKHGGDIGVFLSK